MITAQLTLGGVEYKMFFHCPHCSKTPFIFTTSSHSHAVKMNQRLHRRHILCAGDEIDIVSGTIVR